MRALICWLSVGLLALMLTGCEPSLVNESPREQTLPHEGMTPLPGLAAGAAENGAAVQQETTDRAVVLAWLQRVRAQLGAPYVAFVSWWDGRGRYWYRYVALRVPARWVAESQGRVQVFWYRGQTKAGRVQRMVAAWVPDHPGVRRVPARWVGWRHPRGKGKGSAAAYIADECEVSGATEIVYEPACGCYWLEAVEVVCPAYGGGGDWPPSWEDPWWQDDGGPFDCQDFWCSDQTGGGGGSTGGGPEEEEACDPSTLTCQEDTFPAWGKAVRLVKKLLKFKDKDIFDIETWKQLAKEEWDVLVNRGISVVRLVSGGDLLGVLDCAMEFLVGYNFVGALKELKAAKYLDASVYNELLKFIKNSPLASAFVNRIDDLEVLEDYAKISVSLVCRRFSKLIL